MCVERVSMPAFIAADTAGPISNFCRDVFYVPFRAAGFAATGRGHQSVSCANNVVHKCKLTRVFFIECDSPFNETFVDVFVRFRLDAKFFRVSTYGSSADMQYGRKFGFCVLRGYFGVLTFLWCHHKHSKGLVVSSSTMFTYVRKSYAADWPSAAACFHADQTISSPRFPAGRIFRAPYACALH